MTRLNVSFQVRVPTLHPSMLMALITAMGVLKVFGISVTPALPSSMPSTFQKKQKKNKSYHY